MEKKASNTMTNDYTTSELIDLIRCTSPKRVDPQILIPLFTHTDDEVVLEACRAAGRLADAVIVRHLSPCLQHESVRVRYSALDAILKSECRRLIPDVQEAKKSEKNPMNLQLCEKIIKMKRTADIAKTLRLYTRE